MVLLDWTRMGRAYCLAGAVPRDGGWDIVRPLLARNRDAQERKAGWSAYLLDGHTRWEVFELVAPQPAVPEPPHLEDTWVRSLKPRHGLAAPEVRRQILAATTAPPGEPLFGEHLHALYAAVFLPPGIGRRSLATLVVPAERIEFSGCRRAGADEPDVRVRLHLEGLETRLLPVKDHHLLRRAEAAAPADLEQQLRELRAVVQGMGERVAVRLGLTRPFPPRDDCPGSCWLMADGFFSLADPQP